jgi:hypothetical protein
MPQYTRFFQWFLSTLPFLGARPWLLSGVEMLVQRRLGMEQEERWKACSPLSLFLILGFLILSIPLEAATRRYRLTWRDNPATTATIGFEHYQGSNVRVVYDTQDHGGNVSAYRLAASPSRVINHAGMRNVFVRIDGLQPATFYYFLVVDSEGGSQRMIFETPPDTPTLPLSVIAGGDSRNNLEVLRAANRLVSKIKPHFVMFGGDMTSGDTPAEWQQWLDDWQLTTSADGRLTPIVPARGNHEHNNASIYNLFDVPNPDVYYALDFGGGLLRTYTLNSLFPPGGDQLNWLVSDLSSSKSMWKIAQYHHAMRPHTASKPERDELITYWATQFARYGVNLVVESDAHTVKQTWPIRPSQGPGAEEGFIRDDARGTVYVGEGCWGAPLRANNDDKSWTRSSGRFNQFKWIWVDLQQMQVRTVDIDRSASTSQEVEYRTRFQIPNGLKFWNPAGVGEVVVLPRRGAPSEPPPDRSRPGVSPQANRIPTMRSASGPAILVRDAAGAVTIGFTMPANGEPEILIVDKGMNLLWRQKLSLRGPGPYSERLVLPALPPAGGMELVVKAGGTVVAKYGLQ